MNCSVFVFFFSTIHYLKTHYVVRSPRVGWCNIEHEHGTSSLPWGDFVVSLQALERVHLLLSHKSVLRILSISPIKNLSEHRLCHAALYLIGASRGSADMPFCMLSIPRNFRNTSSRSVSHFHSLVVLPAFDASKYILLTRSELCS